MQKTPAITLILLGFLWLYWATVIPMTMEMRAISDAKSFQTRLWSLTYGKLTEADLQELFTDKGTLRLGGEKETQNFDEMIRHIATSSAPPWWPGAIAIIVGIIALATRQTPPAKSPSISSSDMS